MSFKHRNNLIVPILVGIALSFASQGCGHSRVNDCASLKQIINEAPPCLSKAEMIELHEKIDLAGSNWQTAREIALAKYFEVLNRNIDFVWKCVLESRAQEAALKPGDKAGAQRIAMDLSNKSEGAFCMRQIAWEGIKAIKFWHPGITSTEALSKGRPFDFEGLESYETNYRAKHQPK